LNAIYRKVRIYFTKEGDARFLSHLDLMRTVERALRRADLPVKFTEGMNPKVKMSFPTALPLGMESRCEVVELQLPPEFTVAEICERLDRELPDGLETFDGDVLFKGEKWALTGISYRVFGSEDELPGDDEIARLLTQDQVRVQRRKKELDIKPLLQAAAREDGRLAVSIAWTDNGTARPEDLLSALGRDPDDFRVVKVGMTFTSSLGEQVTKTNVAPNSDQ